MSSTQRMTVAEAQQALQKSSPTKAKAKTQKASKLPKAQRLHKANSSIKRSKARSDSPPPTPRLEVGDIVVLAVDRSNMPMKVTHVSWTGSVQGVHVVLPDVLADAWCTPFWSRRLLKATKTQIERFKSLQAAFEIREKQRLISLIKPCPHHPSPYTAL